MVTYISILRGINVSGQKLIKMEILKEMYERSGFQNVRTYIQSGNVIFQHEKAKTTELEKIISEEIMKKFGFAVPVLVMEKADLQHISQHNPFINERNEDVRKLHVTFLSADPAKHLYDSIIRDAYLPDEFIISGRAIYLFCPNGYGRTKLNNNFFESKLKLIATTRNWKTLLELQKLALVTVSARHS